MEQQSETTTARREIPMARSMCWNCQSEVTGKSLCGQCIKVQPLSKELDYFTCFRLPRLLNIDIQQLEHTFYKLSRTFHPDFFSDKDEFEQAVSLGNSAILNTAYRTLKDPFRRVEYLIDLEAGSVKDIRSAPPADLFEEILELQDDVQEFRAMSQGNNLETYVARRRKLQDAQQSLLQRQAAMEKALLTKCREWDVLEMRSGDVRTEKEAVLQDMRTILSNRIYVRMIVADLESAIQEK